MRPGPVCKRRYCSSRLPVLGPQPDKAEAGARFVSGGLNRSSRIRPNRLFTADAGIIVYRAGRVSEAKLIEVADRLIVIIRQA